MVERCRSEYAECPEGDRRCILAPGHARRGLTTELHFNRAGFAWSDAESAESALRVIPKLREALAAPQRTIADLARDCGHDLEAFERQAVALGRVRAVRDALKQPGGTVAEAVVVELLGGALGDEPGPSGMDPAEFTAMERLAGDVAALTQHILDIDAHATPYGDIPDEPGWVGTYLVTAGALHRALGKIGHAAPKCQAEAERDEARAKRDQVVENAVAWMDEARHQAVERDRLAEVIRRVRELHSPEPGWEQEWKDPAEALANGWPLCRGCRTGTCARRVEDCPTLAALGDAAAKPAACCDMHGRNCEPPSELCCPDCTEAAHDTFPIRHADGSTCSAPDLSGTQPEPGPARAGRFEELLGAEHEQFDRRSELLRSIVEYRDAPSTTVAALGDVGADPDGEQKTATTPDPDPGD